MTAAEAPGYAVGYLHATNRVRYPSPREEYRLHRALQYQLVSAADRLESAFGEVTRKDVATLVEAWVIAQGTRGPHDPLQPRPGVGQDH